MALEAVAYQSLLYKNTPVPTGRERGRKNIILDMGCFCRTQRSEIVVFLLFFHLSDKTALIKAQMLLMACRVEVNCV